MILARYKKKMGNKGTIKSNGTISAKNLLKRLDKEDGAKKAKKAQEDVECDGKYQYGENGQMGEDESIEGVH